MVDLTLEEIRAILVKLLKTDEWNFCREVLLQVTSFFCLLDKEGGAIFTEDQDSSFCKMIKKDPKGAEACSTECPSSDLPEEIEVEKCHAGFIKFRFPFKIHNEVVGVFFGSQIVNSAKKMEEYKSVVMRFGLVKEEFFHAVKASPSIDETFLKTKIRLISFLLQNVLNQIVKEKETSEKSIIMRNILEFYRVFLKNRSLIFDASKKDLYDLILKLVSRVLDCKLCSLMLIDEADENVLKIESAIGLSERIIKRTRLKIGQGIVGHVVATGEPLLVRDIKRDERFRKKPSPRYTTYSLMSVPIKVGGRVVGAINVNNEATSRVFNEHDLQLLTLMCENISVVLDRVKFLSTRIRKEEEVIEQVRIGDLTKSDQKLRELKKKADNLRRLTERIISRPKGAAKPKIEDVKIHKKGKIDIESEGLLARIEEVGSIVDELEARARELEHEAEILRLRTGTKQLSLDEAKRLENETIRLREEAARLRLRADNLRREAAKAERIINKAKQIEELRRQTKELTVLYAITSKIGETKRIEEALILTLERLRAITKYHVGLYLYMEKDRLQGGLVHSHDFPLSEECIEDLKARMLESWSSLVKLNGKVRRDIPFNVVNTEFVSPVGERHEEINTFFTIPLLAKERIIAMIAFCSLRQDAFSDSERRLFSIVASHLSVAIERIRLLLETREMAEHDELTRVYNYRYFEKFFNERFEEAAKEKGVITLMMLDLDRFKDVNDTYGHDLGNEVIREFSSRITRCVKDRGCVARFGGDEFGVVLPGVGVEVAVEVAKEIRDVVVGQKFKVGDISLNLSTSIGLATYPDVAVQSAKQLFSRTDEALYQAKQRGRNRYFVYGSK